MIVLEGVTKRYCGGGFDTYVARDIDTVFPARASVALLGRNGAGKSSLLRLIAGVTRPTMGRIIRHGSVSWPVGFAGSFHPDLTGAQNIRFLARIYGVDPPGLVDFVGHFAEIGGHLHRPMRGYSSGMRARLAFGLSMGIPFDTYLVDEVTSVGDAAFRARSEAMLQERLAHSGAIIVSHSLQHLARICTLGAVLDDGRLTWHDNIMDAIEHHRAIMGMPQEMPHAS